MPLFTVVVPTQDRPELLAFCLEALAAQTHPDIEVIVCDNPVDAPACEVFDAWAGPNWHYLRTPRPLAMHDSWELGASKATGDFLAVVIDKTVLHPAALEIAGRVLEEDADIEVVTWRNDNYVPVDELSDVGRGVLYPSTERSRPERYDPRAELEKMFLLGERRGSDPIHYYRGKICFGAYATSLVQRIKATTGRLFYPLSPDYTSRVAALALAREAVDVGRPLLLSYNSRRSNGRRVAEDPLYARAFVETTHAPALEQLPIPMLYASQHNVVAYDFLTSAERLPPQCTPEMNRYNLILRAREDLELVQWSSESERAEQFGILEDAERRLGIAARSPDTTSADSRWHSASRLIGKAVAKVPPADRVVRWALRKPPRYQTRTFGSPVLAAQAVDEDYASVR